MSNKIIIKIKIFFILCSFILPIENVRSYDETPFSEELDVLKNSTSVFKEKQDLSSLKTAVVSATTLLKAIEEKNIEDARVLKNKVTFRHSSWSIQKYQALMSDYNEDSYKEVTTTIDRYTKPLTLKESKKTGRHNPREIAKETCVMRQDSLEFARKEYVHDCFFAYCLGEFLSTPGLDEVEKQGTPLYHALSQIEDCYLRLSQLFWSIEEVLVKRSVAEQKKSLFHKKTSHLKELVDYWHVGSNAVAYREWINTALSTRFKLFLYAYSGVKNNHIMKGISGSFADSSSSSSSERTAFSSTIEDSQGSLEYISSDASLS
ncbi:MAG: hypothetical protein H2057_02020 [Alphaproteobacteria bacterium]|nr:hypothetical protein [Alphaproteobacteria bacterium]